MCGNRVVENENLNKKEGECSSTPNTTNLYHLHKILEMTYKQYEDGLISQRQYLTRIKPIDLEIGVLEMSTLQGIPALKEAF